MFGDMAWADGGGEGPSDWEMELLRMRFGENDANAARPTSTADEPMELSPDPFYLSNTTTTEAGTTASATATAPLPGGLMAFQATQPPTLTSSASCPSFTSLYDFDNDDLLRGIPDGGPLDGEPLMSGFNAGSLGVGASVGVPNGYDFVLQFQQQHQHGNMRQFPHQTSMVSNEHMNVLQQSRRPLHTSASFTSLSSMETEYKRRLGTCRNFSLWFN